MSERISENMKQIDPNGKHFTYPVFLHDALHQELDMLTNTYIYYQNKGPMNDTVWIMLMNSVVSRWIELIENRRVLNESGRDFSSELRREPPWEESKRQRPLENGSVGYTSGRSNPPKLTPNYLNPTSVFGINNEVAPNFVLVSPGSPVDLTNSIGSSGSFMQNMAAGGLPELSRNSKRHTH